MTNRPTPSDLELWRNLCKSVTREDMACISEARRALPMLLEEVERLREALRRIPCSHRAGFEGGSMKIYFSTKHGEVTERNVHSRLHRIFVRYGINGASMANLIGYWGGEWEPSYELTILGEPLELITGLAEDIRREFKQESVLVTDMQGKTITEVTCTK